MRLIRGGIWGLLFVVGNGGINGGGRGNKKGVCASGTLGLLLGLYGGWRLRNHGKWDLDLIALSRELHFSRLLQVIFKNFLEPVKVESCRDCVMLHPFKPIPSDESLFCTWSMLRCLGTLRK